DQEPAGERLAREPERRAELFAPGGGALEQRSAGLAVDPGSPFLPEQSSQVTGASEEVARRDFEDEPIVGRGVAVRQAESFRTENARKGAENGVLDVGGRHGLFAAGGLDRLLHLPIRLGARAGGLLAAGGRDDDQAVALAKDVEVEIAPARIARHSGL